MTKQQKKLILKWSNMVQYVTKIEDELGINHNIVYDSFTKLNNFEGKMLDNGITLDVACSYLEKNNFRTA